MSHKKAFPFVMLLLLFFGASARADYIRGITPICDWRSLSHPGCEAPFCQAGRTNYSRDFPMGSGAPPMLSNLKVIRDYPFPGEFLTVQLSAQADTSAGDSVSAQFLLWGEITYSTTGGGTWYGNGEPNGGLQLDWFTREILSSKSGSNMYKHFESDTRPWLVSLVNAKWMSGDPAPNRRETSTLPGATFADLPQLPTFPGWNDGYEGMEKYKTFGAETCPWSLNCRLFDSYPPNDGTGAGNPPAWPAGYGGVSCSEGADDPAGTPGADNCNVPGFPEGGGDILDAFPVCVDVPGVPIELPCDPFATDFPNIPGEPLIRVNGVPGISCDVYDDTNPNWTTVTHPLCGTSTVGDIDAEIDAETGMTAADIYELYGILPYTLQPLQGVVKFEEKLETDDVVDAVFYTDRRVWTAKIDMNDPSLAGVNFAGSRFRFFPRMFDTCGNQATGGKAYSSNVPTFNPTTNESTTYVMGGNDSNFDLIPTDLDPLTSWTEDVSFRSAAPSVCSATDTFCPDTKLPVTPPCDTNPNACACPGEQYCECCYNECGPTQCTFLDPYGTMCSNTGDAGNPPGCGSEYGGNTGQLEIHEFKVSHTSANLYLKMSTQGDMEWGCYGVWYIPFVSCDFLGDQGQKSKINAYMFQVVNTDPDRTGTYFLLIVPSIEGLYGPIIAFLDLPKLMGEFASYDGTSSDCAYADGAGACGSMCDKGGETGDPCEEMGCDPENPCPGPGGNPECGPNGNCDGDSWPNSADACPCSFVEDADSDDGCPPEEPDPGGGMDEYMCKSCALEGGDGTDYMYVEMGYDGTINSSGAYPYSIYAATLGIHDLSAEFMDDLLCILCQKGFVFEKLLSDMTPRVNYYARGPLSQTEVEVRADTISPTAPEIDACLGRCGAYDPSTTTIEVKWQEVVFNNDAYKSNLVDLGGYKVFTSRGMGTPFSHYYTICSPNDSLDCESQSPLDTAYVTTPRTDPATDEPLANTRFPKPFDQLITSTAMGYPFNFPGEPISMIIDSDCDIPGNNIDDDKDGDLDEGCYSGAPDTDETPATHSNSIRDADLSLLMDGQEYWFRATAYDISFATSSYSNTAKVRVLRNTTPPAPPIVRAVYSMGNGRTTKVVWKPNTENDMGGYAVYRCPGRPVDAVKMAQGLLPADYCTDDSNYRRVNETILTVRAVNFLDNGKGFYEGGPAEDDDGDGATSEWIDCSDGAANRLNDLALCGNLNVNTATATWATGTEPVVPDDLYPGADADRPVLFTTGLVDGYDYYYKLRAIDRPYGGDGTNDPGTCTNGTNGYTYTNGIDALGGGSGCVNPIDDSAGPPVLTGRQCADPTIKDNWPQGGNCSDLTTTNVRKTYEDLDSDGHFSNTFFLVTSAGGGALLETQIFPGDPRFNMWSIGIPSDYNAPAKPVGVRATSNAEGTAVNLTWNDHLSDVTFDHYRIYRTNVSEGFFSCLRGACETSPGADDDGDGTIDEEIADGLDDDDDGLIDEDTLFRDGCQCASHTDCASYDAVANPTPCEVPWKICTDPPDYTIEPTATKCSDSIIAGCNYCVDDTDCNNAETGWQCAYPAKTGYTGICKSAAADPNEYIDNDGDGMIDEELADNQDNDGDGLIDEDTVAGNMNYVGKCPSGASLKDASKTEIIYNNYYTELYLEPGGMYYYKISAVDNAIYNDPDEPNETPNESPRSTTAVVITKDTKAPDPPTGPCPYVGGLPTGVKPCAELHGDDVTPSDLPGNSMTVVWFSTSTLDIGGYNVYRATEQGSFTQVNSSLIPVPTATGTIHYKVSGLENNVNYYFAVTAVDESGNESNRSGTAGPVAPTDSVAPNPPLWSPLYRDHPDCTALPPSTCTTEINHACDAGGVEAYGKTGTLKISWAPKAETECLPNSRTEGDFSYYKLYRRHYAADTGSEECNATTNQNCSIAGTDCLLASSLTSTEFTDDGCIQNRTEAACGAVAGCAWSGDLSECKATNGGILENDKTYYYCVSAVDRYGNESLTSAEEHGAPVDNLPPDKPAGLTATPLAGTKVGLGWAMLDAGQFPDLVGYVIYRSASSLESAYQRLNIDDSDAKRITVDQNGDTVEAINGTSYVDNYNLVTGQTYYYKITAIDARGNESKKSDAASVIPVDADNTAPTKVTSMYSRSGYDVGETGGTAGIDDDGDGFIDDANLVEKTIELHWDSIKDYDLASYNIYRHDPSTLSNCSYAADPAGDCDADEILNSNDPSCTGCCGSCPLDDCDKDGFSNAIDSCPCTPHSPNTSPFGTYNKLNTSPLSKTTACPAVDHVRPVDTLSENMCYFTDSNTGDALCNGSRYWYVVTGIDSTGNETTLDTATAHPAEPVERNDASAPEKPLAWCSKYTTQTNPQVKCNADTNCLWNADTSKCMFANGIEDWKKPKIVSPSGGGKLLVVFYENDMTATKNQDIQGYTVYRDTNYNGSYSSKRTLMTNKMVECTQQGLPACGCDKANMLDACYFDLGLCSGADWFEGKTYDCVLDADVVNGKKYFYKVDVFDEIPNFSDASNVSSGTPGISESIPSPIGFQVNATLSDPNALSLIWSDYGFTNNPNFTGYMLYRANAASGTYNIIDPQPTTPAIELLTNVSYLDEGLVSGNSYYYWLFSVDADGEKSAEPAQCCVTTGDCSEYYCYGIPGTDIRPPGPPTGLIAVPGNTSVTLTWNGVVAPDLAGYNICRGTTPTGVGDCTSYTGQSTCDGDPACKWANGACERKWTKINTSSVTYTSYADSALTNDKVYWYYVTAYDTSYNPATDTACDPQNRDVNDSMESKKVSATPGTSTVQRTVARGWNLLTVPAAAGARSAGRISIAGASATAVRYDPTTGRYVTEDLSADVDFGTARAFWVYSESGDDMLGYDGEINTNSEVTISLQSQWNLLGNPFMNQFDWNDQHVEFSADGAVFVPLSQAVSNGWLMGAWLYENGTYPELRSGDTLPPFTGFWIRTSRTLAIKLKR